MKVIADTINYRSLIDNSSELICMIDEDFNIIYESPSVNRILGYSEEELLGRSPLSIIHPNDTEKTKEIYKELLNSPGKSTANSVRLKTKNGDFIFVGGTVTNMLHVEGVNAIVASYEDISKRRNAEKQFKKLNEELDIQVKQKTEQLTHIYERISDGFIALDNNWCITFLNRKTAEVLKKDASQLIGKNIWELFPNAAGIPIGISMHKAMSEQEYTFIETNYEKMNKWYENHLYPSKDGLSIIFRDITDKKTNEQAIQNSEETKRVLKNSVLDAVIFINSKGNIELWNKKAEDIFGWTEKEITGKLLSDTIIPERYREKHKAGLRRFAETGDSQMMNKIIEINAIRKNNEEFPIELTLTQTRHNNDEMICAFIRDISERKKAEQKIRESEERYRMIVETAHEGIWMIDEDNNTTFVNKRITEMLGYSREEMTGKNLYDFMKKEDLSQAIERMANRKKGITQQSELAIVRKDGSEIDVYITSSPIIHDGKYSGALGMLFDISELKKAEKKLEDFKQRLTYHIDNTPVAFIEWDNKMKIIEWSNRAEEILGWKAEEAIGKYVDDLQLVYSEDEDAVYRIIEDLMAGRVKQNVSRNRNYTKDRKVVHCEWYTSVLTDEKGIVKSILSILLDVTEEKRAVEELKKSNERFNLMSHATNDAVWDWNMKTNRIWGNRRYHQLLGSGYDSDTSDLTFEAFIFRIHREDKERILSELNETKKSFGTTLATEFKFRTGDGSYRKMFNRGYILYDESGNPSRMIGSMMDITDRINTGIN